MFKISKHWPNQRQLKHQVLFEVLKTTKENYSSRFIKQFFQNTIKNLSTYNRKQKSLESLENLQNNKIHVISYLVHVIFLHFYLQKKKCLNFSANFFHSLKKMLAHGRSEQGFPNLTQSVNKRQMVEKTFKTQKALLHRLYVLRALTCLCNYAKIKYKKHERH